MEIKTKQVSMNCKLVLIKKAEKKYVLYPWEQGTGMNGKKLGHGVFEFFLTN
jgi:hypothetical protein